MPDSVTHDNPGVYHLIRPTEGTVACPLVLDSPHSGTVLPADFHFACDVADIYASGDTLVDQLAIPAADYGATVMCADFTRAYIDLNRSREDIDHTLYTGELPWKTHASKRTQYGLGLIHHLARGKAIYDNPLPAQAIADRVLNYYDPYHACLQTLLQDTHHAFGHVVHLDIHAMPSMNIEGKLLPDIVIGDLDGTSSHRLWRETVRDLFKQAGFVVTVNTPYKGVEIIKRTGKPRQGFHALQIEINKALYLNEQTLQPHQGFHECQKVIASIWQALSEILLDMNHRQAAE